MLRRSVFTKEISLIDRASVVLYDLAAYFTRTRPSSLIIGVIGLNERGFEAFDGRPR
jgi:type IV secretory pathway ATPase VirB11/archaellum biosynthesis ATPase